MLLVDVHLLFDLSNQILLKMLRFSFIVDVEYDKLTIFCSNCKMTGHDLSNCRRLQQDAKVNSHGEKIVGVKIQFIVLRCLVPPRWEWNLSMFSFKTWGVFYGAYCGVYCGPCGRACGEAYAYGGFYVPMVDSVVDPVGDPVLEPMVQSIMVHSL